MSVRSLAYEKEYTYRDYLISNDDGRYELIDGVIYALFPAPNNLHQDISIFLAFKIYQYLIGKNCKVYQAPFDIVLKEDSEDELDSKNVVQPDISIYCDRSKLTKRGATGAPDFIAEIISPSTRRKDYMTKMSLYSRFGVREYWIVEPEKRVIAVYLLEGDIYGPPEFYTFSDTIPIGIFADREEKLEIDMNEYEE